MKSHESIISGRSSYPIKRDSYPVNPRLFRLIMSSGSRFQIRLRTVEGLSGTLSVFVVPATQPKTAHLISVSIKPLSLHEKIPEVSPDIPMNELLSLLSAANLFCRFLSTFSSTFQSLLEKHPHPKLDVSKGCQFHSTFKHCR